MIKLNRLKNIAMMPARRKFAQIVLVPVIFWFGSSSATILTFDQIRVSGNVVPAISGNAVPQDYGDRVDAAAVNVSGGQFTYGNAGEGYTPNVIVDYFTGAATPINPGVSVWADSYGDLVNVIFGNQNSTTLNVRLVADPGFLAVLYSFDLGGWSNTDYTINAVRILDGVVPLFEQSNVLVEGNFTGPRRTAFDFLAPVSASDLLIQINYSNLGGNSQDNIGIDNIRFGQNPPADGGNGGTTPVPLPPTTLLLGLGLVLLSGFKRLRPAASCRDKPKSCL